MIKFCPKCKSILRPRKEEDGKVIMFCSCGYTEKPQATSLKDDPQVKKEEAELEVIEKEIDTLPITKEDCPKCGNETAFYWLQQTRAGDEAETKFMRCTKCKHTWRDYN